MPYEGIPLTAMQLSQAGSSHRQAALTDRQLPQGIHLTDMQLSQGMHLTGHASHRHAALIV
jgi:hypothetical protein